MAEAGYKNVTARIGKQLKSLVRECWSDGSLLEAPKYRYVANLHDPQRETTMLRLVKFMMTTTYFQLCTKIYLSNFYSTYVSVRDELQQRGIELNDFTIRKRIHADCVQFASDFGYCVVEDLCDDKSADIYRYIEKLDEYEYGMERVNCELDFIKGIEVPVGYNTGAAVTNEEVAKFMRLIAPYLPGNTEKVERELDRNVCYYIRRLMVDGPSTEDEKKHYDAVMRLIIKDKELLK